MAVQLRKAEKVTKELLKQGLTPENMSNFNKLMAIATRRETTETAQRRNKVVSDIKCQKQQQQGKRRQGTDDHYQELRGQQNQLKTQIQQLTSLVLGKRRREDNQDTADNSRKRKDTRQLSTKEDSFNNNIIHTTSKHDDRSENAVVLARGVDGQ